MRMPLATVPSDRSEDTKSEPYSSSSSDPPRSGKREDPSLLERKPIRKIDFDEFYQQNKTLEHYAELKLLKFKLKYEENKSAECNFQPPENPGRDVHETLYLEGMKQKHARNMMLQINHANEVLKEMDECTFRPEISKYHKRPKAPKSAADTPSYASIHKKSRIPASTIKTKHDSTYDEILHSIQHLNRLLLK